MTQPLTNGSSFGNVSDFSPGQSGDFNLFSSGNPNAPNGTFYFRLTTAGGDDMIVVSMLPGTATPAVLPIAPDASLTGTINGGFGLRIASEGNLSFFGAIGGSQPLAHLTVGALGSLRLGANAQITAAGDISLGTLTRFINESVNPNALDSSGGSWRVFSGNQNPFEGATADVAGGLNYQFKAYGVSPENLADNFHSFVAPGQDGFVYAFAPTLTVTSTGPVTKVYDGTTAFSGQLSSLTLSSSVSGDVLTVSGAAGQFSSANASTAVSFLLSELSVSAVDAANKPVFGYSLSGGTSLAATITPKELTVSLTGEAGRAYDG